MLMKVAARVDLPNQSALIPAFAGMTAGLGLAETVPP
jgi:hypothetical protein